jgi:hypothetical protein
MGVAHIKVDRDVERRNVQHTEGQRGSETDVPARQGRLRAPLVLRGFTFDQDMGSSFVQLASGFGQRKAARLAIEEARPETLFEAADRL